MNEEGIVEFDVPLGLLPAVFPPGTGERERAANVADGALMGAGEKGERMVEASPFFGGDINGNWRALSFEGEMIGGRDFGNRWSLQIGSDW